MLHIFFDIGYILIVNEYKLIKILFIVKVIVVFTVNNYIQFNSLLEIIITGIRLGINIEQVTISIFHLNIDFLFKKNEHNSNTWCKGKYKHLATWILIYKSGYLNIIYKK